MWAPTLVWFPKELPQRKYRLATCLKTPKDIGVQLMVMMRGEGLANAK